MIHLITGLMSSGKTLYMSSLLYNDYTRGRTILSNYSLNFPHYKINIDYLLMMAQKENVVLSNVSIGLDELWIYLDARRSSADINLLSSYFFLQSSKDDTHIYITSQKAEQLDLRIRDNCHKFSKCSRVYRTKNNEFLTINSGRRKLPPKINKDLYIEVQNFKQYSVGFETPLLPYKVVYIKAEKLFNLYDTSKKMINTRFENGKLNAKSDK